MTPVLALDQVTRTFTTGGKTIAAVDHVDLCVEPGELVIIMGPSGSGKTTLLQLIGALLSPTSGTIAINGHRLDELSSAELADLRLRQIGFIFQTFNLLESLDATDNVATPGTLAGLSRRQRRQRANELLDSLDLSERCHHRPDQLSGGEKQRVAIARALMNDPALILADEPTANLDSASGYQALHLLQDIAATTDKTVLVVTHDHRITDAADRLLWLADGVLHDRQADFAIATDPVCGMEIIAERAATTRQVNGTTVWFCSQLCAQKYDQNPTLWTSTTHSNDPPTSPVSPTTSDST